MDNFGFKDFESVSLKATYNIELGERQIEEGETIAFFDKIQIAGLKEIVSRISANGGFDNRAHVFWETTKEIQLSFSQGVFSKEQFALMVNSKLVNIANDVPILTSMRERLETNENSRVICKYKPVSHCYVYKADTGEKLVHLIEPGNQLRVFTDPYTDVIVDYEFNYVGGGQIIEIGKKLLSGYVSLEGRTRVKDDTTGQVVTGLIKIPKLKLMSDLSIRLGTQASPITANFNAVGVPVGSRGDSYVSEFYLLGDDIDSDL